MGYVYVLKCARGKFYVGYTENPQNRIIDHFSGDGSAWTNAYPPKRLLRTYNNCDKYDEAKITCHMMKKYGIRNVRGGPFVQMDLPEDEESIFLLFNRHLQDACFFCGMPGHYVQSCWHRYYTEAEDEDSFSEDDTEDEEEEYFTPSRSSGLICYHCGEPGHRSTECSIAPTCYRCGVRGHYATTCFR